MSIDRKSDDRISCDRISCDRIANEPAPGAEMSYARFYQHGVKAYAKGCALAANPHDRESHAVARDGWRDGWLDACHAHGRHIHERRHAQDGLRAARAIRIDRFIAAREAFPA